MYTLWDMLAVLTAAALFVPVLVLPGYALARAGNLLDFRTRGPWRRLTLALLAAYAVLPVLAAMLARFAGLGFALAVTLLLAGIGAVQLRRDPPPWPSRGLIAAALAWLALLVAVWIDLEWNGRLYMSLVTVDMIKHAATTRALVEWGYAPPLDPFFLRAGTASFYYFYFVPSALAEVLAGGLIDSRAAVGGQVFWTGLALAGLADVVHERAGFKRPRSGGAAPLLTVLMAASGIQIVTVLIVRLMAGSWIGQSNWTNEMISGWLISLVWVPHHVAGFIASWTALLVLAAAMRPGAAAGMPKQAMAVAFAGAALASAAGLSIWVTAGTIAVVALFCLVLANERRWRHVGLVAAAGLASLVFALPYLIDLVRDRAVDAAPVAFAVRDFLFASVLQDIFAGAGPEASDWRPLIRLLLLPANYLIELGVFAAGAVLFWRRNRIADVHGNETARLLTLSAIAALLVGSFVKSTILNNDLGWRVMMFLQLPALLWTAHLAAPYWQSVHTSLPRLVQLRFVPRPLAALLALGFAGVAYDLVTIRFPHQLGLLLPGGDTRHPVVDREIRQAFEWLNRNAARQLVVQHNPAPERAFGYALYGRQRVAVADRHAPKLLGAPPRDVQVRLDDLLPVFAAGLSTAAVRDRARRHGVDLLFVTAADPVWAARPAWLVKSPAVFESANLRVIAVERVIE